MIRYGDYASKELEEIAKIITNKKQNKPKVEKVKKKKITHHFIKRFTN